MKKRDYSLDLLKILACFGVIILHVFGPLSLKEYADVSMGTKLLSKIIYYAGVFAIPIFFMVNGFFVLQKKNLTYSYIIVKVKNIAKIIMLWVFLFGTIKFPAEGIYAYYELLKGTLFQERMLYHFWFLYSLIFLLLLAPILKKIIEKKLVLILVLSFLIVITIILDTLNHFYHITIQENVPQAFRMWTWIFYYLLGGSINTIKISILKKRKYLVMSFLIAFSIVYQVYNSYFVANPYAEYNYDNIFIILTVYSIFITFNGLKINAPTEKFVRYFTPTIMGIYIVHVMVLKLIVHFYFPYTFIGEIAVYFIVVIGSFGLVKALKYNRYSTKFVDLN